MRSRALVVALGLLAAACGKEGSSGVTLQRTGDEPAVVEVEGSAQLDLASAREVEPNDRVEKATVLELPVAVTGVLSSSNDVDRYRFVAPKSGAARILLAGVDGIDLMVAVNEAGKDAVRVGDRGPKATPEGVPNMPIEKGKTYIVTITEFVKKARRPRKRKGKGKKPASEDAAARTGDSPPYQLEVSLAAIADDTEREPNDDAENARIVLSGDRPTGFIGWTGDVDFWKLSLEGFTEKDLVEISIEGVDGVTLSLELLDPDGKKVLSRQGGKSGPIYVRGLQMADTEHLIARISAKRSHESQRYRLHFATRRLSDGDEVEPNDTAKTANPLVVLDPDAEDTALPTSGEARGLIVGKDVDWFVLRPSTSARTLSVTASVDGSVNVQLEAIAKGEVLDAATGGIAGTAKSINGLRIEAGVRVRLKVSAKGSVGEPSEYTLSWSTTSVAAPDPSDGGGADPDDGPAVLDPVGDPADELE